MLIGKQPHGASMAALYAVFSLVEGAKPDIKIFSHREDSRSYAKSQIEGGADTVDLYQINDVTDPRSAKAALEMGEGHFIEAYGRRATKAELEKWELQRLIVDI